jgi:hypothetical protein
MSGASVAHPTWRPPARAATQFVEILSLFLIMMFIESPAAVSAGHDPQLEKAVQVLMTELKKNPPVTPKRPACPNKVVPR